MVVEVVYTTIDVDRVDLIAKQMWDIRITNNIVPDLEVLEATSNLDPKANFPNSNTMPGNSVALALPDPTSLQFITAPTIKTLSRPNLMKLEEVELVATLCYSLERFMIYRHLLMSRRFRWRKPL
jgi:hypothetical protein